MAERTEQISALVYRDNELGNEFLALHRSPERGGFWQSVTGGVEVYDADHYQAARRELMEELQLKADYIVDPGYNFSFHDDKDGELRETVVGARVDSNKEPVLSDEHDMYFWLGYRTFRDILPQGWEENIEGLDVLWEKLNAEFQAKEPRNTFHSDNWSVLMLKPDAFELGIQDLILEMVQDRGLDIVASIGALTLTEDQVEELWVPPTRYKVPQPLDAWWYATIEYVTRAPVDAFMVNGEDASKILLAIKSYLRTKYGKDLRDDDSAPVGKRVESIMHCSDRPEELVRNSLLFWPSSQIREMIEDRRV